MDPPFAHDPAGKCDSRLLFYPLRKFPVECDNDTDPVTLDELAPIVNKDTIVYEFTPDESTRCWDAASLYMTLRSQQQREGGDGQYPHPLNNCIVPFSNVQLIFLTARLCEPQMRAALKNMLWKIAHATLAGAVVTASCLTLYNMCLNPQSLISPLQQLLGYPVTDDMAHTLLDIAVTSMGAYHAYDGARVAKTLTGDLSERRDVLRQLDALRASNIKKKAYEELLARRKNRGLEA
jgi:hypothetical protein